MPENPKAATGMVRLCDATRRDGAQCQGRANAESGLCPAHGGKVKAKPGKGKTRAKVLHAIETLKGVGPETRALPEFQTLEKARAYSRLVQLAIAHKRLLQTGDAVQWIQSRDEIMEGHRKAEADSAAWYRRRYLEREAQGIPHPEDRSKW
jgi:hypothetical protein